jgi:serine phosphatase RsbU (regulator of sigma subunit)
LGHAFSHAAGWFNLFAAVTGTHRRNCQYLAGPSARGDYFDVIELPDGRTLFAVADVSGKGMLAALLAASIQGLVRSISLSFMSCFIGNTDPGFGPR